ncbi:MAG TPA: 16S rRNA (cytosine(967)-C(5))-methyltransferase RsmB [Ramlibacter sp.]|uniref:16S rRNA (cytosine(967)-C(5))-methyltransferase RsmB n=1 Tax=Ramlibacter sp. TaxID=1917967 RepID=UPI002CA2C49F|nr:16S rRNA (cytosine(967)-C(5))-methyltransferase RsmB [Ramlibacter sp.]HVZ44163.1 16S rRNA (cytosine(967)-C(5))-methyltransferase RsmB [Ramlibacter sp.]
MTAVPLWRQLQAAASVIAAVRSGESATPALARVPSELRGAAQSLSFHALRELGRAQALRSKLARRAPAAPADALLLTALALCWRAEDAPYESFTLVDQAVEAAKHDPAMRGQHAFVNACLRRFLRERDALVAATDKDPVARWNHPKWWIERVKADWPDTWQQILEANNEPAPLTLRVNTRRWTRDEAAAALDQAGIASDPVGEAGLVLQRARAVNDIPGFAEGKLSVQDAGAQVAAALLLGHREAQEKPLRILDACAAPGGKTAHIAELSHADLLALDIDPARCERIEDNLRRLGLHAKVQAADAGDPASWWDGRFFDAILLDAPCTASGIVRRHPDVRWLRREADIASLSVRQARLLDALWPLVKNGGRFVYCTCSVFRAEGEARIAAFVAHNKAAVLQPGPGHLMPQTRAKAHALRDNLQGDHDGFYYALLQKRGS